MIVVPPLAVRVDAAAAAPGPQSSTSDPIVALRK